MGNRLNNLLEKLRSEPLSEERTEFGKLLMIHIDDLTPSQKQRYNELNKILIEHERRKQTRKSK